MPPTTPLPDAPVITGHRPDSFARAVFHDRHPKLFAQLRDALAYGPAQLERLRLLGHETVNGVITPLEDSAGDAAKWNVWGREYFGLSWTDAPFLWAESYFYRKLLAATGYFGPGAWAGVDPFGPLKEAELASAQVDLELAAYDAIAATDPEQQDVAMLLACLWGNRADLGFQIIAGRTRGRELLTDDSTAIWSHLRTQEPGRVSLIADNAARELLPDLMLLDYLLTSGLAAEAVLYVKPAPYYVSDATTTDANAALRRLVSAPGNAGEAGRRLWQACATGRLVVSTHEFFCAPHTFHDLPADLSADLAGSRLTLLKGDLNYRRLVGDRHWPPTTGFQALTRYFPSPVAALRTCKSDVAVGLDADLVARLDADEPNWRVSGAYAVIQLAADGR
jgi:hypothetical protein